MTFDEYNRKFSLLSGVCEDYIETEDRLRYLIYGYQNSLDLVVPFNKMQNFTTFDDLEYKKLNIFINEVLGYYPLHAKRQERELKPNELLIAKSLLLCGFHFLATECNYMDYTFLSIRKLLKTFDRDIKPEYDNDLDTSTFFIMYSDIKETDMPDAIREAYEFVFSSENYSSSLYKTIAYTLLASVRFFLYNNKLDFTSDSALMSITDEIMNEIFDRLKSIHTNKDSRLYSTNNSRNYISRRRRYEQFED